MGRYIGASCRLCRREGGKLYLKGTRCDTPKCALENRGNRTPGVQGDRFRKLSDYGVRLREKQKLKRIYGMREKQFRRLFGEAARRKGVTGEIFLILLERRFDNIVYRMGMASSRKEARQLITHGFFLVNGKILNIPSYVVKEGDVIEVKKSKQDKIKEILERVPTRTVPVWLEMDMEKFVGKVLRFPLREEIDIPVEEHMVVELYSR